MRISRPSARTDPSVSINPAKTFKRVSLSLVRYSFGMCLLFKRLYLRRYFLRGASKLEMDTASRVLLPKSLQEYANLEGDLILLAYGNKIEIWNKAEYEKMLDEEPSDFSALAEEVMTNRKKEGNDGK